MEDKSPLVNSGAADSAGSQGISSYNLPEHDCVLSVVRPAQESEPVPAQECDLLLSRDEFSACAPVRLVPSIRTNLRRALDKAAQGFEVSLVRPAATVAASALVSLALAAGVSTPAQAADTTLPGNSERAYQCSLSCPELLASTTTKANNHILRRAENSGHVYSGMHFNTAGSDIDTPAADHNNYGDSSVTNDSDSSYDPNDGGPRNGNEATGQVHYNYIDSTTHYNGVTAVDSNGKYEYDKDNLGGVITATAYGQYSTKDEDKGKENYIDYSDSHHYFSDDTNDL